MFSASDLIDALDGRRPRSRLAPPPGEFPPGWRAWLAARREDAAHFLGDTADRFIALLLQRPLRAPARRVAPLNRWQAFAALWRQQWDAADPGDRRMRLLSMGITALIHLLLLVLLLWLAYVHLLAPPPAPAQGEDVVQVEYIGDGTPVDAGGGAPVSEFDTPDAMASAGAAASARPPAPDAASSATASSRAPQPQPEPPAPAVAQQEVQVSERPEPDARFTLPAPSARRVDMPSPQVRVPELREAVAEVEVPQPPTPVLQVLQPDVTVRPARAQEMREPVREVEVPQPLTSPVVARQASVAQASVRAPALSTQVQSLPMPSAPAPGAGVSPSTAPGKTAAASSATSNAQARSGNTPAGTAPAPGGARNAAAGAQPGARAAGVGAQASARPGGLPSPRRGDDWGVSDRNVPGGNKGSSGGRNAGIFNPDGSIRMPPSDTFPRDGDTWSRADLDRAGRWLKRPPNDFTPTRFDQYWLPGETLLQEWVRRGIKTFEIALPGGRMKIVCMVSILQAGGGCGLAPGIDGHFSQPAVARKPPVIPFKRELMEDGSALSPPPAPAPGDGKTTP